MNIENIIERVAAKYDKKHTFTELKPIKLEKEGGYTKGSLDNAKKIKEAGYEVIDGNMYYDFERADWWLEVGFARDKERPWWSFGGFSFGYSGEGPHGLLEFGKLFGLNFKEEKVFNKFDLPEKGTLQLKYFWE